MINPADLVTNELIDYCKGKNLIIVCGYTKTGKYTIAKKLSTELNRILLVSDNYQIYGADKSLYILMDDLLRYYKAGIPIIVEGILAFRLLRKSIQLNNFTPDLILKTECDDDTIKYFYNKDGEGDKIVSALGFNKGLNKIWNEYLSLLYSTTKQIPLIKLNTSIR